MLDSYDVNQIVDRELTAAKRELRADFDYDIIKLTRRLDYLEQRLDQIADSFNTHLEEQNNG